MAVAVGTGYVPASSDFAGSLDCSSGTQFGTCLRLLVFSSSSFLPVDEPDESVVFETNASFGHARS